MRKIFLTIICISAALALCGCRNNTNEGSDGASSQQSSSSAVQSGQSSSVSSQNSGAQSDSEGSGTASDSEPSESSEKMAQKALDADEWPQMDSATEQNVVDALFSDKIVLADCEDFCLMSNTISAQLYRIMIVKPKADKSAAVEAAMNEYFDAVRSSEEAFYPEQQESAAGAVKGKTDKGYIYIIVHPNGKLIAEKMLSE